MKITLPRETLSSPHSPQTEAYSQVDKSTLSFPEDLPKPWDSNHVTLVRSATVARGMDELLGLQVPGLKGVTIREVLDALRTTGRCLSFPFGVSVRDQFVERSLNDVNVEVSCSAEAIWSACVQNWGAENCRNSSSSPVVHIGNSGVPGETEAMDAAPWNSTFFSPVTNLDYTISSLAYDSNVNSTGAVFDLTSFGVKDGMLATEPFESLPHGTCGISGAHP